jgi:RND family efflux transporter MFP subunit
MAGATEAGAATMSMLSAVLFSDLDAETAARMDGVVREVRAELGDAVREGQVLLVLDDAREVARLESATAALELARATFVRIESLLAKSLVTPAQMDEARFAVKAAEASLREAQVEFEHTRVVAPFTGVITRRMAGRGRSVQEGEPLFRLTALEPLRALVRLPERDARGLRLSAPVVLLTDDGQEIAASIQRISPATDPESGTVEVLLAVPRPGPLRPGSSASLRLR